MPISAVLARAPSRDLTTLRTALDWLRIDKDPSEESRVTRYVTQASRAIERVTGRTFARENITEKLDANGRLRLILSRTPVLAVSAVREETTTLTTTDYELEDKGAGFVFNATGWKLGRRASGGIARWPTPEVGKLIYEVDYVGGYLLPGDDLHATTISADASDKSYNDSASGFPVLAAGDLMTVSGFADAADNGTRTVVSRTAAKVVVAETLVTEAASRMINVKSRDLPEDLEQAALELVAHYAAMRARDPSLSQERIGDWSGSYGAVGSTGLPAPVEELLKPWMRAA